MKDKLKVQNHLLPTESKVRKGQMYKDEGELKIASEDNRVFTGLNLYQTSDEKIEEGDYFILDDREVLQCDNISKDSVWFSRQMDSGYEAFTKNCRKIVATTDEKLLIDTPIHTKSKSEGEMGMIMMLKLPQISQSFIESYCKHPVDECYLEMESIRIKGNCDCKGLGWRCECNDRFYTKLKLTPENEVIVCEDNKIIELVKTIVPDDRGKGIHFNTAVVIGEMCFKMGKEKVDEKVNPSLEESMNHMMGIIPNREKVYSKEELYSEVEKHYSKQKEKELLINMIDNL